MQNSKLKSNKLVKILLFTILVYGFFATLLVYFFHFTWIDSIDEAITVVLFVYMLLQKTKKKRLMVTRLNIYIIVFCIWGFLGSLISRVNIQYAPMGMFLVIKVFILYRAFEETKWTKLDLRRIINVLKKIYILIMTTGFLFFFVPTIAPFKNSAMVSICNHPAVFGTLMVPCAIYCIINIVENGDKKYIPALIVSLACIVLARTTKNIISLGTATLIYLVQSKKSRK